MIFQKIYYYNKYLAIKWNNVMNKIVLLGTGGGPRIWSKRSQPSSALVIEDDIYIIDECSGEDVKIDVHRDEIGLFYRGQNTCN